MNKWLDKMIEGNYYEITEIDGEKKSGTFEGLITDNPEWTNFIVIQEKDKKAGTLVYLGDIAEVKNQIRKFDCEVIFDEFGFCQFFEMEGKDEAEALEKLYEMEPSYKEYKVNLYDITHLGGIDNEY